MRFRPRVFELEGARDVGLVLAQLRERRGIAALDSAGGEPKRWSIVAFDPLAGVETPRDIAGIRAAVACLELQDGDAIPGPFHAGFIGALSYDLGVAHERTIEVARDPWSTPRVVGGVYVDFIVIDERAAWTWLVLGEGELDGRASVESRRASVVAALSREPDAALSAARSRRSIGPLVRHTSAAEHGARIERVREFIAAGDIYQANLAYRSTRRVAGHPVDFYRALRAVNPAPYMGYFAWDERLASGAERFPRGAILSASPELLLEFDGRSARTRPIKGTAPRGRDAAEDRALAADLLASAKDRAELAMIVDLERNDLGRCAQPGGVRVERFPHLETYASVHHLTADVVADVPASVDAVALLEALFPGGSITGAPKLRSMEVIAELEGEGRGFFTGSFGFVDTRGHAAWNVLIRTLVWRPLGDAGGDPGGEVSFHVGGGITWSSDPESEERETQHKAAAIARALECEIEPAP
jgi:para-aminobenzoate synthetase component I